MRMVRIRCRIYPFLSLRFVGVLLRSNRSRSFLGSFSNTSSYERCRQSRSSECVNASRVSSPTQWFRARYGAGMMLGCSVNSANSSAVDLKEIQTVAGSSETTANILPPTFRTRWLPHWICSVACGREMQNSRTESMVMSDRTAGGSRWGSRVVCGCALQHYRLSCQPGVGHLANSGPPRSTQQPQHRRLSGTPPTRGGSDDTCGAEHKYARTLR